MGNSFPQSVGKVCNICYPGQNEKPESDSENINTNDNDDDDGEDIEALKRQIAEENKKIKKMRRKKKKEKKKVDKLKRELTEITEQNLESLIYDPEKETAPYVVDNDRRISDNHMTPNNLNGLRNRDPSFRWTNHGNKMNSHVNILDDDVISINSHLTQSTHQTQGTHHTQGTHNTYGTQPIQQISPQNPNFPDLNVSLAVSPKQPGLNMISQSNNIHNSMNMPSQSAPTFQRNSYSYNVGVSYMVPHQNQSNNILHQTQSLPNNIPGINQSHSMTLNTNQYNNNIQQPYTPQPRVDQHITSNQHTMSQSTQFQFYNNNNTKTLKNRINNDNNNKQKTNGLFVSNFDDDISQFVASEYENNENETNINENNDTINELPPNFDKKKSIKLDRELTNKVLKLADDESFMEMAKQMVNTSGDKKHVNTIEKLNIINNVSALTVDDSSSDEEADKEVEKWKKVKSKKDMEKLFRKSKNIVSPRKKTQKNVFDIENDKKLTNDEKKFKVEELEKEVMEQTKKEINKMKEEERSIKLAIRNSQRMLNPTAKPNFSPNTTTESASATDDESNSNSGDNNTGNNNFLTVSNKHLFRKTSSDRWSSAEVDELEKEMAEAKKALLGGNGTNKYD